MDDLNVTQLRWRATRLVGFRALFVFFFLIIFPFPFTVIPGVESYLQPYEKAWDLMVAWTGSHILGIADPIARTGTGSSDKLYDWVWYFVILCLTSVISLIWTVLDRRRPNYITLRRWLVVLVSYYVAYYMFVYGITNLFYLQFLPPNLEQLFQSYGQSSPMRLLWTFMGFSRSYTIFAGACETLAGILLVFNRTRTLGAIAAAAVMLNVFMLNISYDVPLKLFSLQLMLMACYVASVDYSRILDFALSRRVPATQQAPLFQNFTGQSILAVIQIAFVVYVVYAQTEGAVAAWKQYGPDRPRSELYGVYDVESFVQNGDTLAPLLKDPVRWKRVLFDYPEIVSLIDMQDRLTRYSASLDTAEQTITLSPPQDTVHTYEFSYQKSDTTLHLAGVLAGDSIRVNLIHYDLSNFGLLNREFHWITEVPYNRYNYE